MKKLEKLTLKELGNESSTIEQSQLQHIIGGADYQSVVNFCWGELQNNFSSFTKTVDYNIDAIQSAIGNSYDSVCNAVSDFYNSNQELVNNAAETAMTLTMYVVQGVSALTPFFNIPAASPTPSDIPEPSGSN